MRTEQHTNWLSYGAGVISTAMLVALMDGRVKAEPWRVVWADTKDEKDETYSYVFGTIMPWLRARGRTLEVVCGQEGVLERWERLEVTGSRIVRACTSHAKIYPMRRHVLAHGTVGDTQLVGIDADEQHRAKQPSDDKLKVRYPLIELDWGRDECVEAIKGAGLPVPPKSGCWHCPFMRKAEVVQLAISAPCKFERIVALEDAAAAKHGQRLNQWGNKTAREWRDGGSLFVDASKDLPCACWDGDVGEGGAV